MRLSTQAKGTLENIAGMAAIFALDVIAGAGIDYGAVFDSNTARIVHTLDDIGTEIFIAVTLIAMIARFTNRRQSVLRVFLAYLVIATVQTLTNIAALLVSAHVRHDNYLWGLWDVGATYLMIVSVFTGWYWVSDQVIANGAFVFPAREGKDPAVRNLIDYVFIAFNTNATFGPTTESVVSRRVKILMMLQASMSLVLLLVLVARIVS